jgi:hypothetical protein
MGESPTLSVGITLFVGKQNIRYYDQSRKKHLSTDRGAFYAIASACPVDSIHVIPLASLALYGGGRQITVFVKEYG